MTYRSESECLRAELKVRDGQLLRARAENERLRTALKAAEMPTTAPKRWVVEWSGVRGELALSSAIIGGPFALVVAGALRSPFPLLYAVAWCLAFVRRRPL